MDNDLVSTEDFAFRVSLVGFSGLVATAAIGFLISVQVFSSILPTNSIITLTLEFVITSGAWVVTYRVLFPFATSFWREAQTTTSPISHDEQNTITNALIFLALLLVGIGFFLGIPILSELPILHPIEYYQGNTPTISITTGLILYSLTASSAVTTVSAFVGLYTLGKRHLKPQNQYPHCGTHLQPDFPVCPECEYPVSERMTKTWQDRIENIIGRE